FVAVLDDQANVVRVLVNGASETTGNHSVVWDGTDGNGQVVADGTYTVVVDAVDVAGNQGQEQSVTVQVLVTPPPPPSTPVLDAASDSSTKGDDITNDNTPTFDGTAQLGTIVIIYSDGFAVGSGPTDAN